MESRFIFSTLYDTLRKALRLRKRRNNEVNEPNPHSHQSKRSKPSIPPNQTSPESFHLTTMAEDSDSPCLPDLPEPIVLDILSRLPVADIRRLKSLSTHFRRSLSTPHFAKLHLRHHPLHLSSRVAVFESRKPPSSVAFRCVHTELHSDQPVASFRDDFKYSYPNARIWNSCDGLILFSVSDKTFFAFNPSIRDGELVRQIPSPCPLENRKYFLLLGLGFDALVDEYKVVGAVVYCESLGDESDDSFVFCSSLKSTNSSRLINYHFPYAISKDSPGTNVNGVLYWMVNRNLSYRERVIIYFDFTAQVFVEMTQPTYEPDVQEYSLGVLRGSLCVVCSKVNQVEVLGLDMGGGMETWVRLFVVNSSESLHFRTLNPLCFTEKGEVIMAVDRKRLVVYNLEERTHRLLFSHPEVSGEPHVVNPVGFEVAVYVETLVSPRSASKGYHSSTGHRQLRLG